MVKVSPREQCGMILRGRKKIAKTSFCPLQAIIDIDLLDIKIRAQVDRARVYVV